jgi:hypothetical protein
LDDIFADLLTGPRAPQYRKLLFALVHLSEHLNGRWVADKTGAWVEEQRLKGATLAAADLLATGGPDIAEQVRGLFHDALTSETPTLDPGLRLTDTARTFRFLDRRAEGIRLGIAPLDDLGLELTPGMMLMYIAAKGRGKTWFAVHCGKQALRHGHKVLHVTLEISDVDVAARYYSGFFTIANRDEPSTQARFHLDAQGLFIGAKNVVRMPKFYWQDPEIRSKLRKEIKDAGLQMDRLLVKEFPAGSLTLPVLEHHLDYLAFQHNFVPDVLIIDYPDLMRIDHRELRIGLGRLYVGLRGLAARRKLALVVPTQGNRGSLGARRVRSSNVSEDITKVQTADVVLTYSATDWERGNGIGRLLLEHARHVEDKVYCMIAQDYARGQFIVPPATDKEVTAFRINSKQSDADLERLLALPPGAMDQGEDEGGE